MHPSLLALHRCLQADWFLVQQELRLQAAHATVLLEANVLQAQEHDRIQVALRDLTDEYATGPAPDSECEDLHTWVEFELVKRSGEAGKKIHTARSRNDQVATLLVMYLIDAAAQIGAHTASVTRSLCHQATRWSDTEFPLHTHTQFAAPGSVGAWFLRFAVPVERLRARLEAAVAMWQDSCPLGSGAVAGSSIPIDRHRQAALLGFRSPSLSALDATTSRDECVQFLGLLAHLAIHMQSFATDCILFAHPSLAWIEYPKAFATGSSMMPNKSNPDALELLRGESCALQAAHAQALLLLKGLPSGYNRDLQCIKPIVHAAATAVPRLLDLMRSFVDAVQFDHQRLAAALELNSIGATLAMEDLVRAGVPLRDAHHATADSIASGNSGSGNPGTAQIRSANAYQTAGSASPAETRRVAAAIVARLGPSAT